ncbi:hypothetical protein EMPS_04323 [Entomortierella parvispora]|uniref:ER-bound oxygenase mpaB/mpaB'/Rubber oxygenase catalytic domain-containing protein n=1 Tax=Entomortierella parvispora TaxID=205924 RepID=A0A9P3LVA4_9FUNG|nr:hypothetical protein EMPS_04323 [Entomortierella parvispora]
MSHRHPRLAYGGVALAAYMLLVRHMRYRRIRKMQAKYPDPTIPLRDHAIAKEVLATAVNWDFPYMAEVALEFALFKTYAVPTISKILAATQQFSKEVGKRAEDTGLILMEITQGYARSQKRIATTGVDSPEARAKDEYRAFVATERLNFIHSHYPIKQEDFLYTLALFIKEPHSFIDQYEWRPLTELECNAYFAAWRRIGEDMNIENIPDSYEGVKIWAEEYERKNSVFAKSNVTIADQTVGHLLSRAPAFLHPFGRLVVASLLTPSLRRAFGYNEPPKSVYYTVHAFLQIRRLIIKYLMLPRRTTRVRSPLDVNEFGRYVPTFNKYAPVYKDGYRIEDLGPTKFLGKCPVSFHPSGITPPHDLPSTHPVPVQKE